jgi:glycosyltransferase involved in cell wall biosynthesis
MWLPPRMGHWVLFQPWEFGSIPEHWLSRLAEVDEVWVNSRSTRDAYISSGIPAKRVRWFPLGVDANRFHPNAKGYSLKTQKKNSNFSSLEE